MQNRDSRDINFSMARSFPSLSRRFDMSFNVNMFTQDIPLTIMRLGKQSGFTVELQGEKSERDKAKEIISQLCRYQKHSTKDVVCDAVDNIARHLAWEGQDVYEIKKESEEIYIRNFTSQNLFKILSWHIQIIPRSDWNFWKRKISVVKKEKIWKVRMPHSLGGPNGYVKILKMLNKHADLIPVFYTADLQRGIRSNNVDIVECRKNSDIYINRATQKWGWNRRDTSQDRSTEFYSFYKELSFRYAQTILYNHIISEINILLKRLSVKCELIVNGLPTPEEILQIRNDMQKGTISHIEAYDKCML